MTQIFGHRGAAAYAPENTLASFELALEQGVDGVEFDVHLSKDGVPVIIHDETVDRTTSGTGAVADLTLAELKALDASGGRPGFTGARIPTLTEVLDLVVPSGVLVNIELKNSVYFYTGLEDKVLEQVDAYHMEHTVILSSFNHESLHRIQELRGASLPLGVLYQDVLYEPWHYVNDLNMPAVHPWINVVSADFVRACHDAGLAVRPWTVDGAQRLRTAYDWGVDALFTNMPDVAVSVRG